MDLVLDSPMRPYRFGEEVYVRLETGNVVASFYARLSMSSSSILHHPNGLHMGESLQFHTHPIQFSRNQVIAAFHSAVLLIEGARMLDQARSFITGELNVAEEPLQLVVNILLIVFHRKDIVGLLATDCFGWPFRPEDYLPRMQYPIDTQRSSLERKIAEKPFLPLVSRQAQQYWWKAFLVHCRKNHTWTDPAKFLAQCKEPYELPVSICPFYRARWPSTGPPHLLFAVTGGFPAV